MRLQVSALSVPDLFPTCQMAGLPAARAVLVQMNTDAWKKVDQIKKENIGDKWDELTKEKK